MKSIRGRLLASLGIALLLLFAGAGALIHAAVRARVEAGAADDVEAMAQTLAAGLELAIDPAKEAEIRRLGALAIPDPERTEAEQQAARRQLLRLATKAFRVRFALDPAALPEFVPGPEAVYFAVCDPDGIIAEARTAGPAANVPTATVARIRQTDTAVHAGAFADRVPALEVGRSVADVHFRDPGWAATWQQIRGDDPLLRKPAWVYVIRSRSGIEQLLGRVRAGLLLAGLLLALLIALTSWFVVRRGLAPVTALSEQVGALDGRSLGQRIDEATLPLELQPIAHRLNEALARIEAAVERERLTAGHIAHELRTPVAELRSITDIASKWPEDAALQAQAVTDSHAVALHMSRVVNALLKVARAGIGADAPLTLEPLDLAPLLRSTWEGLRAAATARNQTMTERLPERLPVRTDPDVAEAILANLLKNAIEHAPPGSTVEIGATTGADRVAVTLANPAPDMTPEDATHAADAFWRKDAARTRSDESGLGLTLAYELCRSADIDAASRLEAGRFVLELRFPAV